MTASPAWAEMPPGKARRSPPPVKKQESVIDLKRVQEFLAQIENARQRLAEPAEIQRYKETPRAFNALGGGQELKQVDVAPRPEKAYAPRTRAECADTPRADTHMGEVRNQDGLGWCYAYTAADLLSQRMQQRLSAADIGISYSRMPSSQQLAQQARKLQKDALDKIPRPEDFSGGHIEDAIQLAGHMPGVCREEDLGSDNFNYRMLAPEPGKMDQRVDIPLDLLDLLREIDDARRRPLSPEGEALVECIRLEKTALFARGMDWTQLLAILRHAAPDDATAWIQHLSCEGRRVPIPMDLKTANLSTMEHGQGRSLFAQLDAQLSRGNPVGISYAPHFFYSAKRIEIEKEQMKKEGKDPEKWRERNSSHASTIVGRRFNPEKNRCEYLVRNSWGKSCDQYNPSVVDCTEGNLWVGEADMDANMSGITYIRP